MSLLIEQEEQVRKQIADEREAKNLRLASDYREVLGTDAGRNVLRHIVDLCKPFGRQFTGNSNTYYLEGRADVGKEVLMEVAIINPKLYYQISVQGLREQYLAKKEK